MKSIIFNAGLAEKVLHSGASGISAKFKVRLVHISQSKYKINQFVFISARSEQSLPSPACSYPMPHLSPTQKLSMQLLLKPRSKLDHRAITFKKLVFTLFLGREVGFFF